VRFSGADLSYANLSDADLRDTDLTDADTGGAKLTMVFAETAQAMTAAQ
jgi:uncharacterized protein YjbI with pentapeptide repeats